MDSRKKVTVCLVISLILIATTTLLTRGKPYYGPAPFPMDSAEKLSVDELADKAGDGGTLILPTWMPSQIKLRQIYFKGLAILVYSDEDVRDYRDDDVTIQIVKTRNIPTKEQLLHRRSSGEVIKVKESWIVISEDAVPGPDMIERGVEPIFSYFWHDGFYYIISGIKGETTREDMIKIVENMEPVGQETLRKA